jgi:glucose-1-phosphate thymidylyltransferase
MKGVILAGGNGTRLHPLTFVTNKHLLPVYNKPMIYWPIETLVQCGITEILIVSGRGHAGHFLNLLGSGKKWNARFTYEVQENAGGIADALSLAEDFSDGGKIAVILGDNIFTAVGEIKKGINRFTRQKRGAMVFLKQVKDPHRFGVAEIRKGKIVGLEEKPRHPKSKFAVTGMYLYDENVFDIIRALTPSGRGELEVTDVNKAYVKQGVMFHTIISSEWRDAGTFDSLLEANVLIARAERSTKRKNGK